MLIMKVYKTAHKSRVETENKKHKDIHTVMLMTLWSVTEHERVNSVESCHWWSMIVLWT